MSRLTHGSQHPDSGSTLQKPLSSIIYNKKWTRNFSLDCEHAPLKYRNSVRHINMYTVYIAAAIEYEIHTIVSTFVELLGLFVESSDEKLGTEKAEEYVNTSFMKWTTTTHVTLMQNLSRSFFEVLQKVSLSSDRLLII